MKALWRDRDLEQRFTALTALLLQSQPFWRHHAFKYLQLPWERAYPRLATHLHGLSLQAAEHLSADEAALSAFAGERLPLIAELESACRLGEFPLLPARDSEAYAVPGRKWKQVQAFARCVPLNTLPLVEWCAGKAHLGRLLAKQRHSSVMGLERDVELIAAGRELAARTQADVDFLQIDVMTPQALRALDPDKNVVALHACGDLHRQLLHSGVQQRVHSLTLAPCCYQLIADETNYVLSQRGKQAGLQLQRDDLRTAVQGSVTAPLRERKKRQHLQAWRLGFDLLQRELRGVDAYLPTPPRPTTVLQAGFADFCLNMAAHHHWQLPARIEYSHYESAGYARLRTVAALDLPRIAHRRALEIWLALDRALFLREHGYAVTMGIFCGRGVTPRNICIRAENAPA